MQRSRRCGGSSGQSGCLFIGKIYLTLLNESSGRPRICDPAGRSRRQSGGRGRRDRAGVRRMIFLARVFILDFGRGSGTLVPPTARHRGPTVFPEEP